MRPNGKPMPTELPLASLHPFPNHPYKVADDEAMFALMDSIDEHGILSPVLVRPEKDGYEIISGHRRCHAARAVGLKSVPAIVCDLSRDEAAVLLVDSNLHREHLLPSEKAFAYKLKMDALKHQGKRTDNLTCGQAVPKSRDTVSDEDSGRTVQRYIRLTNLIPELLRFLDRDEMALSVGEALSYLDKEMQYVVLDAMEAEDCTPSYSQAVRLKNLSRCGELNKECIMAVMQEQKANQRERVSIPAQDIRRFFPAEYTMRDIERSIVRMLEAREQSRKTHGREERQGEAMRKRELIEYYKVMFTEYPDVVNVEQLGEMLGGTSNKSIYRLLKSGEIQSYMIGKRYRIPKVSVIEYLTGLQKSVS